MASLVHTEQQGMKEIRGIDVDKAVRGFADEANILKKFVTNGTTKAREIRHYVKTAGFLDSTDSTGMSASLLANQASKARFPVIQPSWTRDSSYVKKFMAESPMISLEDLKDSDIDVFGTTIRDVVLAVARKEDLRIFTILFNCLASTPTLPLTNGSVTVLSSAATAAWDLPATANPIKDVLVGQRKIRQFGYDPKDAVIGLNSLEYEFLIDWLINTKGSSLPDSVNEKAGNGVLMSFMSNPVIVSEHFTTKWAYQWIPRRAATWKSFMPATSAVLDEPGVGKKVRVWSEGELILHDPHAVHVIIGTDV